MSPNLLFLKMQFPCHKEDVFIHRVVLLVNTDMHLLNHDLCRFRLLLLLNFGIHLNTRRYNPEDQYRHISVLHDVIIICVKCIFAVTLCYHFECLKVLMLGERHLPGYVTVYFLLHRIYYQLLAF